ncbi:MAG: shikimate kinase [Verrucomicrobia bacterium]|nr:shikimate kinase [Verrucomicrobiota bacterium]MBU4290708.1 shikimate kinase [Verrucomicrobiota bacterium]MBU4497617.1 shikimate kinase [Verrucomicrobiota bacterium]MCG2679720.1 shikimate kinase [Kiritimatiellia bacterium]
MKKTNIILIGFMGTGKSAVGKRLAQALHYRFVDMDERIAARVGKPITRIFAEDGEPRFRTMERAMVQELAGKENLVVATGGGIVLNPDNIREFSQSGLVVCLSAAPDEILRRVGNSTHRPLLNQPDPAAAIRDLLAQRQPLYDAIPCQVNTTGKTVEEVAERIVKEARGQRSEIRRTE